LEKEEKTLLSKISPMVSFVLHYSLYDLKIGQKVKFAHAEIEKIKIEKTRTRKRKRKNRIIRG